MKVQPAARYADPMPRPHAAVTLGFPLLALLSACAPTTTVPQTQIQSSVQVQGQLLTVHLLNTGPRDLLLQNDCPRPFQVSVLDASAARRPEVQFTPLQTCAAPFLPPALWRVGDTVSATVELPLTPGTRTLAVDATMHVKLAASQATEFRTVRVNVAPFQVTVR